MSRPLLRFEVYRSAYPVAPLGERLLPDVEARDHRAAKQLAAERHPGIQVVVLPSSAGRAPVRLPLTKPDSHQDPRP
jgi:hypothetical protein